MPAAVSTSRPPETRSQSYMKCPRMPERKRPARTSMKLSGDHYSNLTHCFCYYEGAIAFFRRGCSPVRRLAPNKAGIEWHLTGDFAALLISISADVSRFIRPLGYLGTFRNARSSDPTDGRCHHVGGARQAPEWFRVARDRLNAGSERSVANALGPLCLENIWKRSE